MDIVKIITVQLASQCLLKTQTETTVPRISPFRPKPQFNFPLYVVLYVRVVATQSTLVWEIARLDFQIVFSAPFRVDRIEIGDSDFEVMSGQALQ